MNINYSQLRIIVSFLLVAILSSCEGTDDEVFDPVAQLEKDQEAITDYLQKYSIDAEADSIYDVRFIITTQGSGRKPQVSDVVNVDYEGRLLADSSRFDGNKDVSFPLNRLIGGWQICLPYLREGGTMIMYIPSGYGYGPNGSGSGIPSNANLLFKVTLNSIE
jgi:FKBP-type peptidyl-prolyl cis-trans isomerase FkpA